MGDVQLWTRNPGVLVSGVSRARDIFPVALPIRGAEDTNALARLCVVVIGVYCAVALMAGERIQWPICAALLALAVLAAARQPSAPLPMPLSAPVPAGVTWDEVDRVPRVFSDGPQRNYDFPASPSRTPPTPAQATLARRQGNPYGQRTNATPMFWPNQEYSGPVDFEPTPWEQRMRHGSHVTAPEEFFGADPNPTGLAAEPLTAAYVASRRFPVTGGLWY